MQSAIVVEGKDIKRILAIYFGVDEKNVIQSKYSYTIIGGKPPQEEPKEEPEDK